jgi:hypothetical protein
MVERSRTVRPVRPTVRRVPCADGWPGRSGPRGSACAGGTRGYAPGAGCSAGRSAWSRGYSVPVPGAGGGAGRRVSMACTRTGRPHHTHAEARLPSQRVSTLPTGRGWGRPMPDGHRWPATRAVSERAHRVAERPGLSGSSGLGRAPEPACAAGHAPPEQAERPKRGGGRPPVREVSSELSTRSERSLPVRHGTRVNPAAADQRCCAVHTQLVDDDVDTAGRSRRRRRAHPLSAGPARRSRPAPGGRPPP